MTMRLLLEVPPQTDLAPASSQALTGLLSQEDGSQCRRIIDALEAVGLLAGQIRELTGLKDYSTQLPARTTAVGWFFAIIEAKR